jgi:hypothetical protein
MLYISSYKNKQKKDIGMNISGDNQSIKMKKRLDLFGMFYPLERKDERRWAKIFKSDFKTIAEKFKEVSTEKGYKQEEGNNQFILWRDADESSVECMFYFIKDVTNFSSVYNCFKYIEQ